MNPRHPVTDPKPGGQGPSAEQAAAAASPRGKSLRHHERVVITSLSANHLVNDAYANFLGPLLPLLITKLNLTIAQAGWLGGILTVSSSFMQPLYGYLSDRYHGRFFAVFGPLITTVFMSCIGVAPNFLVLAVLLGVAGVGVASFHPQGAALIASASRDRRGLGMSIFVGSGTLGFAVAPLYVTYSVTWLGLDRSYLVMIPGVVAFAILYFLIPHDMAHPASRQNPGLSGSLRPIWRLWRPLLNLYLLVVIRSAVQITFVQFLPLYFTQKGHDLIFSGSMASLFMFFGAMGGLVGGPLADRVGSRRVIVLSTLLAGPTLAAFLLTDGPISAVWLSSGAAFLLTTLPVNVVMAQKLLPERASIVASLMMGFAWGLAGMAIPVVGALADHIGLGSALLMVVSLLLVGFVLSLFLPKDRSPAGVVADTGQ